MVVSNGCLFFIQQVTTSLYVKWPPEEQWVLPRRLAYKAVFEGDSEIMTILFNEEESRMTFFGHIVNNVKWGANGKMLGQHHFTQLWSQLAIWQIMSGRCVVVGSCEIILLPFTTCHMTSCNQSCVKWCGPSIAMGWICTYKSQGQLDSPCISKNGQM